ncbi:MAG: tetratricopeptide repeat protein [Gemmatimonadetes bacterium]|jgi:protein O-mannosyl-transferase|nr:tetratricopeptide repeat protein [Gemmatimonadota bacterium]
MPFSRRLFLFPIALFLGVFLLHLPSLGNGFHYDDGHSLLRNPHIRSLASLPAFFHDTTTFSENPDYAMFRPLVLVAHALNYAWGLYDPFGYHLLNLIIHSLATLCVYTLLKQLNLPATAALLGAFLFGLHPVQTEPINYISSRSESLAALFYLFAFSGFIRASSQREFSWLWYPLSLAAFSLGLLSKATALTLPLALLLYEFLLIKNREARSLRERILKFHLSFWFLSGFYLIIYRLLAAQGLQRAEQVRPPLAQLATQIKALIHYIVLAFMPVNMSVFQQFWVSEILFTPVPLLALFCIISLLGIAIRRKTLSPLLPFALGWLLITLLPTLIIPLHILVNDHRLYPGLFGFSIVAAFFFAQSKIRWPFYLLCLFFAFISFQRDRVWKDELTLWQDAASHAPLMPEVHYNIGFAHHKSKHLSSARQAYERAVQLNPQYARAQTNLGALYRETGESDRAIQAFSAALQSEPDLLEALNNLGLVYRDQGKLEEALVAFQRVIRKDPELAEAHFNLGLVYRDKGDSQKAFEHLSKAIQLDPDLKNQFSPR